MRCPCGEPFCYIRRANALAKATVWLDRSWLGETPATTVAIWYRFRDVPDKKNRRGAGEE